MAKRLKAIALYSECTNNGVEYAIREDKAVFVRHGVYQSHRWTTTAWKRCSYWEDYPSLINDLPDEYEFGFTTIRKLDNPNLRLPQGDK